jgi:phospholipase C
LQTSFASNGTHVLKASYPTTVDFHPSSGIYAQDIGANQIQHIVIIFQENRTPDNLFHGLPGADIANTGLNSKGEVITLQPIELASTYGLAHGHGQFTEQYDNGKMDGANKVAVSCTGKPNCPPNPQYMYVNPSDVQPYFDLAQQYTFGDRMFQTNQGGSFPAHQFIISGTSAPSVGGTYGDYFAAENPQPFAPTGCVSAPAGAYVQLIDPQGVESASVFPCFEHPTLNDLLDNAGVSWRFYTPNAVTSWTAPAAIDHLRLGPDWSNVIYPQTQVLTDIADGNLAQVAWVIPGGGASDHPGSGEGLGPSWVASVVNAIGNSGFWNDTAIIITWDDWGGWYDHVAPTIYNSYEYGFRVPLIVVSPYAKQSYVSHVTHDFGSILAFVENVFSLPSLGYADSRADDLADCFNFNLPARPFKTIAAPFDAAYFIEQGRTTPQLDPDED